MTLWSVLQKCNCKRRIWGGIFQYGFQLKVQGEMAYEANIFQKKIL